MTLNLTLRKTFLYIFASVGLVITIIGSVSLINLGLKTYVFTKADRYCYDYASVPKEGTSGSTATQEEIDRARKSCEENQTAQRQSQASNAIAMLIVGAPLYLWSWTVIKKENQV